MKIYKIIQGILIMSLVIILGACTQDLPPDDDTNPDGGDGGGSSAVVDLQTGLIAYYPFTGNLQDLSGHGHNGISHSTSLIHDRFGNANQALALAGSMTSYMEIPHNSELNLNGDFTICFWVNMNYDFMYSIQGYQVIIGKGQDISNFYGFITDGTYVNIHSGSGGGPTGGLTSNFLLTNSKEIYQSCAEFQDLSNDWYFVALYNNQTANKHGLYVNTEFIAEKSYFNFTANNIYPLIIGRHFVNADGLGGYEYPFKGNFDDLRIYNRALTVAELEALYEATE